nr:immunoglobulin light chain junction region [Macaca mulatta]
NYSCSAWDSSLTTRVF